MKLAIIGCGIIGGGIARKLAKGHDIALSDHHAEKAQELAKEIGAKACGSPQEAVADADWVFIAMKPQDLEASAKELAPLLDPSKQKIISVLAGKTVEALQNAFGGAGVLRIMPNLPMIYGKGVIGAVEDHAPDSKENIEALLSPLGNVHWVPESQIDELTAIAGSGPGFVYAIIEAMQEAAEEFGFSPETAESLVREMLAGSLELWQKSGESPEALRKKICSPKGSTLAGLEAMQEAKVPEGIKKTFQACYKRTKELGSGIQG